MGKQVNFYMDKETEDKFISMVLSDGVQIYFRKVDSNPYVIRSLSEMESDKTQVYFFKLGIGDIKLCEEKNGNKYIDSAKSSVIEFLRTSILEEDKAVSRGRLWVDLKYYNEKDELKEKPKELNAWFIKLSNWIRKNVPKVGIDSCGKTYYEHISSSMIELINNGYKMW